MFPPAPETFTEIFWRGQNLRFALALHDDMLLFWEPDSPQFQSEPQEWIFGAEGLISLPARTTLNANFLVTAFRAALQSGTVGRMLYPDSDKCVFLHPQGIGSISPLPVQTRDKRELADFRFAGGDLLFTRSASYWLERLAEWASEPENDFAFALSWRSKNDEERAQSVTQLSRGDWNELRCVAQWLLLWEGHDHHSPGFKGPLTLFVRLNHSQGHFSLLVGGLGYNLRTKRQTLWEHWFNFFSLSPNSEAMGLYIEASRLADRRFSWEYSRVCVPLSQHEYLETHLQLRDWLRDRIGLPDQRIAELLA